MNKEPASGAAYWDHQAERSTPFMLWLLVASARLLGRPVIRLILWPVALYFWITGTAARRSSRDYLRRVLGREPSLFAPLKHFYTFALVSVDRIYLLGARPHALEVTATVPEDVLRIISSGRGSVLLTAHFGSFESLRVKGTLRNEAPISIVLDRQVGQMAMRLLEALNPQLAAGIIDASRRGPELVLDIRKALDAGNIVGIMADRVREDERAVRVDFLGGTARMPAGPWMIASMLDAPVVCGFGVYRGGRRYDCHLELFAEHLEVPRESREQRLQVFVQRYADRLATYVQAAPYNWFNFYDYWFDARADAGTRHATTQD